MIITRYADDLVIGFERQADAHRFLEMMRKRFEEFALSLHPEKTRLIEFGRYAVHNRKQRGLGKPETFNFLGFTLICSRTRQGAFQLKRKTRRDRSQVKLREIKEELRRRRHYPIPQQGQWLQQVVRGFFAYHAVPTNFSALVAFRRRVIEIWRRTLKRRSQREDHMAADTGNRQCLAAQTQNPAPVAIQAVCRQTSKVGAVCGKAARTVLCGGRSVRASLPRSTHALDSLFICGRPPPAKDVESGFGKMVGCSHMSGPLVRCI